MVHESVFFYVHWSRMVSSSANITYLDSCICILAVSVLFQTALLVIWVSNLKRSVWPYMPVNRSVNIKPRGFPQPPSSSSFPGCLQLSSSRVSKTTWRNHPSAIIWEVKPNIHTLELYLDAPKCLILWAPEKRSGSSYK